MSTTDERGDRTLEGTRVPADGDDIAVIPTGPPDQTSGQRRRALLIALAVVAALVAGALAIVSRNNGSKATVVQTAPPTVATTPAVAAIGPKATTKITAATPTVALLTPSPTLAAPTVPIARTRQTAITEGTIAAPVAGPAPTLPPPPKRYGASALTWAAPHTMTIAAGAKATLVVTAHNPTDGIVTLPHPLSCSPHLDHSEICTENVQLVASGRSARAQYTIDARGIAPGPYTLDIEGVLTVSVTVVPAPA